MFLDQRRKGFAGLLVRFFLQLWHRGGMGLEKLHRFAAKGDGALGHEAIAVQVGEEAGAVVLVEVEGGYQANRLTHSALFDDQAAKEVRGLTRVSDDDQNHPTD